MPNGQVEKSENARLDAQEINVIIRVRVVHFNSRTVIGVMLID